MTNFRLQPPAFFDAYDVDDKTAFMQEMADVVPIKHNDKVAIKSNDVLDLARKLKREAIEKEEHYDKYGLSLTLNRAIDPYDVISYKQDGIQTGVFKNLRLGKYPLESRLKLTQMTIEEAKNTLAEAIELNFTRGIRVMLIQHGLGIQSQTVPGKLKSYVNMWLPTIPHVIACHSAHSAHGGLAATYVMMKKNPHQKMINREKHAKRS
jgi:DNA-nicking Smr family endonuclease